MVVLERGLDRGEGGEAYDRRPCKVLCEKHVLLLF
jgi:hypothetical protein